MWSLQKHFNDFRQKRKQNRRENNRTDEEKNQ